MRKLCVLLVLCGGVQASDLQLDTRPNTQTFFDSGAVPGSASVTSTAIMFLRRERKAVLGISITGLAATARVTLTPYFKTLSSGNGGVINYALPNLEDGEDLAMIVAGAGMIPASGETNKTEFVRGINLPEGVHSMQIHALTDDTDGCTISVVGSAR